MSSINVIKTCNLRTGLVFLLLTLTDLVVVIRLFSTQILQRAYWQGQARAQHVGSVDIPAERGTIYSSDGFPLSMSSFEYNLFINPSEFTGDFDDLEEMFGMVYSQELSKRSEDQDNTLVDEKREYWKEVLSGKDKLFAFLEKNVSSNTKKAIEDLNISWVGFIPIPIRYYPEPFIYSPILGFVGKDREGREKGYFGVEGFYDGDLNGVAGYTAQERSAGGSPILFGDYKNIDPVDGSSLKLTIDRTIQNISYAILEDSVKKYGAKAGVVLSVNPEKGEILSLVSYPTFDSSNYEEYYSKDPKIFINKAISESYEPGSVIKALTMSAAIDLGLVNSSTTMTDSGPVVYSGYEVDNWDKKHHGQISMEEVLQLSDNIGAAWVGEKVGDERLYEYFINFGLDSKLDIDLEGEESGILRSHSDWQDIDLASAAFGQGISATPLQVLMSFAAISNGGVLMKPYVVKALIRDGKEVVNEPKIIRRVISEGTSLQMIRMLQNAVSGGEAKYFVSDKYYVAGKTGTAQISEKGEYLTDETNATFVGFLPNYKEFAMLVKLERPKSSIYASETAVPVWMEIAEKVAVYLGISPDK